MIKSIQTFYLRYFSEILVTIFIIFGFFGILHHDMWHDEIQAWMIAINSHSLSELYANLKYESHPPLWYWLLMLIQRFFSNPISMQILHLGIASLNAWLVLKYAPFNRLQKVFLVFGYSLFYEYMLISRGYVLGVLFVFLFCIVASRPNRNYLLLALILILLCYTSMMGLILAVVFAAFLTFEFLQDWKVFRRDLVQASLSGVLFLIAALSSFGFMLPPEDGGFIKHLMFRDGPHLFFNSAYFPVTFNVFYSDDLRKVSEIISILLFLSSFLFLALSQNLWVNNR